MIEVEIPNDIEDFEPKIIGPFTKRMALCIVAIVATSLGGYFILNNFFNNGLRILIPLIFDLPWALIAAYKPYGMKFEEYFVSQIYTTILPPKHRRYRTENLYEKFEKELINEEKTQANTKLPKIRKGGRS